MKVRDLTGAKLSYWTGRAEGKEAEDLAIYEVPRTDFTICIYKGLGGWERYMPSVDWRIGGPILERMMQSGDFGMTPGNSHGKISFSTSTEECCCYGGMGINITQYGDTVLEATMRTFVVSKFGEEVPDGDFYDIRL